MPQLVSTEDIISAYRETGSVWKAAKRLGLCGQSVWERLQRSGHKLPGSKWTDEEINELKSLVGQCPLSEIARRLGRPYGSVAGRVSEMGLSGRVRSASKPVSLRGTGLTKQSVAKLIGELDSFTGAISQFCRQRGLSIDLTVKAIQKYEPDFWTEYSKKVSNISAKECSYCGGTFYPLNKKQETCSRKCQAHARADRQYFNGQRRNTVGLSEGVCQICLRERKVLASHHVWGKENDPDADFLIAVCNGCHDLVGRLGSSKLAGDAGFYERLMAFAFMRRNGDRRPIGYHVYIDAEELTPEEVADESW